MRVSAKGPLRAGKLFGLCLLAAFVAITLMSECSFLYPINDWNDAQCFFTVGRTISSGKVLYRDIYEQKGPLLYFLHACVDWLPFESANPFLEIYILEVLCAAATLFFLMKTLMLYTGKRRRALACLPLLVVLVYCSSAFVVGDSAEEFALPMAAYVLYATLRMLCGERHELSRSALFGIGFLCGCVFWIKYTCLFFALGAMAVPLAVAIRERNGRLLGRAAAFVTLGVLTASIPVAVYFGVHKAFDALWEAYFYNNIFAYSFEGGLLERLRYAVGRTARHALHNFGFVLFALGGWIYMLRQKRTAEAWHLLCIVAAVFLSFLMGGRIYAYSLLPLSVLSVVGAAGLWALLACLHPHRQRAALCTVCLLLCAGLSFPLWGRNFSQKRADVFAYRVVEAIDAEPGDTLLDVGFLDNGLYTAGNFQPITRYFCRLNVSIPEMKEEWRRVIRNGEADFVYTGERTLDSFCPPEEQAPYVLLGGEESNQRLYKLSENRENR